MSEEVGLDVSQDVENPGEAEEANDEADTEKPEQLLEPLPLPEDEAAPEADPQLSAAKAVDDLPQGGSRRASASAKQVDALPQGGSRRASESAKQSSRVSSAKPIAALDQGKSKPASKAPSRRASTKAATDMPNESAISGIELQGSQTDPNPADLSAPIIKSEAPPVIVQFLILPENQSHAETYTLDTILRDTKPALGRAFGVHPNHIFLSIGSEVLDESMPLSRLKDDPLSVAPVNICAQFDWSAQKEQERREYKLPDVLEVRVGWPDDEQGQTTVLVKIVRENLESEKPFLGGFRHKQNGLLYHHAATQTKRKQALVVAEQLSRETQTINTASRSQQTCRESGTQMDRNDLVVDGSQDVVPNTIDLINFYLSVGTRVVRQ
jgi:hypothetical protein